MRGHFRREAGTAHQLIHRELHHRLGGVTPDVAQLLQRLGRQFVGKLADFDILLFFRNLAVHVNLELRQRRSKPNVDAPTPDGLADLVGADDDFRTGGAQLLVEYDLHRMGRRQGALDQLVDVGRPLEYVDVLIPQFAHNGVDARAFHTDARTNGVDPLVVADDRYFGPVSWLADDALDLDDTFVDLGHLHLKEPLHEQRGRPADDNLGTAARVAHDVFDDGTEHVALAVTILVDLLLAGQHQLHLVVNDQHLAAADLVDLANDDLADQLAVFLEDVLFLDVADLLAEGLPGRHHGAPPKVLDVHLTGDLVFHLEVLVDLDGIIQFDLGHRILQVPVLDDLAHMDHLDVPMVGVKNDLKGIVRAIPLANHRAEDILHDELQYVAFDALFAGDLRKGRDQVRAMHTSLSVLTRATAHAPRKCRRGQCAGFVFYLEARWRLRPLRRACPGRSGSRRRI